jgi:hypothetical protein
MYVDVTYFGIVTFCDARGKNKRQDATPQRFYKLVSHFKHLFRMRFSDYVDQALGSATTYVTIANRQHLSSVKRERFQTLH